MTRTGSVSTIDEFLGAGRGGPSSRSPRRHTCDGRTDMLRMPYQRTLDVDT
ncbi:hypothetical protein LVQ62_08670 [Allobranchiibius sp. GilTou73]|nr:hypothetical protein [Allobranchiibius sp. GilTou73]UIJ36414.1 hypothetical protein LVQ62_08670 [Allobranchiibius sp. GilTou73]